jgi:putative membrane protein
VSSLSQPDPPQGIRAPAPRSPGDPGEAAPAFAGDGWRRLDVRMLLVHPVRELVRLLPVLAGVLLAGSSTGRGGLWGLTGASIAIGLGVLRWFTTSYRIAGERIQVRRGVLRREMVSVSLDRVRTVDISASPLHRVLGLVRVNVGTGLSDRKSENALRLDGISAAAAERLRDDVLRRHDPSGTAAVTAGAAEQVLAQAPPSWTRYGPFTLSGFLTVLFVLGFAWRIVSEARISPARLGETTAGYLELVGVPLWLELVGLALVLLVVVAVASTVGYVLAFWGFRLVRSAGGSLRVSRGLLSTRSTTIEERRLRGVEISEPLLLRFAHGARCIAIATGLRVGRGAERGGTLLLPPAPAAEARRVAAAVLSSPDPVTAPLAPHGPRAHRRRYTRMALAWIVVTAVLVALPRVLPAPSWSWELSPALLPFAAALAYDRYRSLGHALAGRFLVTCRGSLVRRRCVLVRDGIIGWNLEQSFFQRRSGLVTLVATTAAGRQQYAVQDVTMDEALRVAGVALPDLLAPFLVREGGPAA